ncbi:MAG TPA: BTAD domain-containing putative transcriptional regulator [Gaiellaceae bacterium]|nr:BTAD domain-containing putative transcriptional regulator [Gaiellaceae bacterium]
MEFRILGPLEVCDGGRVLDLGGPKPRALLAILLVRAGEVVSSGEAIEQLWGEARPRSAAHLLHVYVSRLRKALAPEDATGSVIATRAGGYVLDLNGDELDSHRFERLLGEGMRLVESGELGRASVLLHEALAEWRGPALADFRYEAFGQAEITRLEELRLVALEQRIEADLGLGRHPELVGELGSLAARYPDRERVRGQLMLALYRSGRQAEALQAYREGRRVLVEELGLEPSPALRRLEHAILRHDPELELERVEPGAGEPARKLVTVVVAQLTAATGGLHRLDPQARRRAVDQAVDTSISLLTLHGAAVQGLADGAVLAVFGVPTLHEDEAERAVRCALELREALAGGDLDVRIGIQTGEALVGGPGLLRHGDLMESAERLRRSAAPHQILVGRETVLLTSHVVEYSEAAPDGATTASAALRLLPERRRVRSRFVGRERELDLLGAALERAIARCEPQVVVVLGEPGIGKSRLAAEFAGRAGGRAGVFRGSCVAYGEGSMWSPLAEVVRHETGIGGADTNGQALGKLSRMLRGRHCAEEMPLIKAQLAPLAGLSRTAVASGQELLWSFRRYLEELASTRPAAIVLDDLQWSGDTLLETLQELIQTLAPVPLAIVLLGRPELRERLAELFVDERTTAISLGALSDRDASTLVDNLMAELATTWGERVRRSIVERAGGNPLFLEEVAAMAGGEDIDPGVPQSLRALIAARLELLPPETKRVAQAAAVVGETFWDGAVAALAGGPIPASALRRLRTSGFVVEEAESAFLGNRQLRFHHALIHEVTYESIRHGERSELHRRAAAWLGERRESRAELIVPIAGHLERWLSLLQQVAPLEPPTPACVEVAVDALRQAATWTVANAGVPEAIALLRRALATADGNPELTQLSRAQLAAMLARSGAVEEAVELAERALAGAATPEGTALASLALAEAERSRGGATGMRDAGERALAIARSLGLRALEVDVLELIALADFWSGRLTAAEGNHRRAAELALELGDVPRAAWNLGGFGVVCLLDLGELGEAERQAGEAMRLATESASLRALEQAHAGLGHLRRVQDRLEEAVEHGRERLGLAEKLGEQLWLVGCNTFSLARPLIYLGRREEAWACLERASAVSDEMGGSAFDASVHGLRVGILLAWGRLDEAAAEASLIDPVASPSTQVAELRAALGRHDEAEDIWRRSLDRFLGSENRLERAETMVGYARFLADRRRTDEARATLDEARGLVAGTGAAFHERLLREAQALIE